MLKKYISITLAVLTVNLFLCSAAFAGDADKDAKRAEKVRTEIQKLGTGKDARVEVKLKDGSKVKGYVQQANDTGFVVMNDQTGAATEIPYPQTKQAKGYNLSNGAKIAIGVGIVVVIVIALALLTRSA